MKRHRSKVREPRGRAQYAVRPVLTETGKAVGGLKPLVLVWVDTGDRQRRRDFFHQINIKGLDARYIQTLGGKSAYEVCGTSEGLEALLERHCILSVELCLNVRGPYLGARPDSPHGRKKVYPSERRHLHNIRSAPQEKNEV